MTDARRRFSVNAPDWGEDHLTLDAIVAFTDGELTAGAHARAATHIAQCPECADEVVAQDQASLMLRSASAPAMPSSLLSSLRSIPLDADLPEPPAGLAMSADGQLVSVMRPLGGVVTVSRPAAPEVRLGHGRRLRIGAGVAVSGLALGALALAAPSASLDIPAAAANTNPASLRSVAGAAPAAFDTALTGRTTPGTGAPAADPTLADLGDAQVAQQLDGMAPSFLPPSR
ncbi:anti-sigma factor family protein [Pseudonocardia sp.]|uniref:anti-sigma factor family protein n=1 Tax=Pseudonocardia sp. TaxID=60912 RepID=UPI003D14A4FC